VVGVVVELEYSAAYIGIDYSSSIVVISRRWYGCGVGRVVVVVVVVVDG